MKHMAAVLAFGCIVVFVVNEVIRIKFGFISDRHFVLYWLVWAFVLAGLGVSVGLLLGEVMQ